MKLEEHRYEVQVTFTNTPCRTVWVWATDEEHARRKAFMLAAREHLADAKLDDKAVFGNPTTRKISLVAWTSTGRKVSALTAQADGDHPDILSE